MKINIWNRDRKGGHKLLTLVAGLGTIYLPSAKVKKVVKQLTGRKLRRAANKAAKQADATYQEDMEDWDSNDQYWDNLSDYYMAYEDEPDDYYDPWEYDDYFDDLFDPIQYRMDHKVTEVINLHTGNIIAVFSNPSDAAKFINDNTDRPLQVSRISGYGTHFSCFD